MIKHLGHQTKSLLNKRKLIIFDLVIIMIAEPSNHRQFMPDEDYSTEFYRLYYGLTNQLYYDRNLTTSSDVISKIEGIDFDKTFSPGRVTLTKDDNDRIIAVLTNFPCQTIRRNRDEIPKIKCNIFDQIHSNMFARFEDFYAKSNSVECELSVICPTCFNCLKIFNININCVEPNQLRKKLSKNFESLKIQNVEFVKTSNNDVKFIINNQPQPNIDLIDFVENEIRTCFPIEVLGYTLE